MHAILLHTVCRCVCGVWKSCYLDLYKGKASHFWRAAYNPPTHRSCHKRNKYATRFHGNNLYFTVTQIALMNKCKAVQFVIPLALLRVRSRWGHHLFSISSLWKTFLLSLLQINLHARLKNESAHILPFWKQPKLNSHAVQSTSPTVRQVKHQKKQICNQLQACAHLPLMAYARYALDTAIRLP